MDEFLLYALIAGLGMAIVASSLGVFVVWRRMAYFGDTLAHAALLGVVVGVLADLNLHVAIIFVALLVAVMLLLLQRGSGVASDTLLGILSHGSLAVALLVIGLQTDMRIDLMSWLFGDILAVSRIDLIWIWGVGAVVILILFRLWNGLLSITVDRELAEVDGISVRFHEYALLLLIALVVAMSIKIVGVLLITAMMLIPAAAARRFSQTPEQMLFLSMLLAAFSVLVGLSASWWLDTPAGPSIVSAALLFFLLSRIGGRQTVSL